MSGEAGKGDKDRTTSHEQCRKNHENIKGLNSFVPYWMRKIEEPKKKKAKAEPK